MYSFKPGKFSAFVATSCFCYARTRLYSKEKTIPQPYSFGFDLQKSSVLFASKIVKINCTCTWSSNQHQTRFQLTCDVRVCCRSVFFFLHIWRTIAKSLMDPFAADCLLSQHLSSSLHFHFSFGDDLSTECSHSLMNQDLSCVL